MESKRTSKKLMWWLLSATAVAGLLSVSGYFLSRGALSPKAAAQPQRPERSNGAGTVHVQVAHPRKEEFERTTSQPGSVYAFESVDLFAGVSGFLGTLNVDIGDPIKKGQVLAKVDVPDLEKQVQRNAAMVEQARSRITQMKARADSARAELDAARASVPRAETVLRSKKAWLLFRDQQYQRMKALAKEKAIEDKLVDESYSHREAVREEEIAAQEGVVTAKANVMAMDAKVKAADADVAEADAEVKVAQAELEKSQVMVRFATIVAPFDGVVTKRNVVPRDYVRAATEGGNHLPLLTVQRTDVMRVVVEVPDRDVPYCDPDDPAIVELDALPDQKLPPAKVARIARSEDHDTRLMQVEIDLPNPTGKICNGMYGRVTIILTKATLLTIPSSSLVGKWHEGKGNVYVVRNGRAHLTPVTIGSDNGVHVSVLGGLTINDQVVQHPGSDVADGAPVEALAVDATDAPHTGTK